MKFLNSLSIKKLLALSFFISFAVLFQNCGSSSWKQISQTFQKLGGNGNGQGYPGKVDGSFATIDTTNVCGRNSATVLGLRDRVELRSAVLTKTVENCQVLAIPKIVNLNQVTAIDSSQQVMVIDDRLYQTGDWVHSDGAPVGQFTDLYCSAIAANGFRVEVSILGGLFSKSRPDDHSGEESSTNLKGQVLTTSAAGLLSIANMNDFQQSWHGDTSLEVEASDRVRIRFDSFALPGPFVPSTFRIQVPGFSSDSFAASACWVPF